MIWKSIGLIDESVAGSPSLFCKWQGAQPQPAGVVVEPSAITSPVAVVDTTGR